MVVEKEKILAAATATWARCTRGYVDHHKSIFSSFCTNSFFLHESRCHGGSNAPTNIENTLPTKQNEVVEWIGDLHS